MKKNDLVKGEDYAFYTRTRRGYEFTLTHPSESRQQFTINNTHRVTVLDVNHEYERSISRYSTQKKIAKGILVRSSKGDEILPTAQFLVMPWEEFEEKSKALKDEMDKRAAETRKKVREQEELVGRAIKVGVFAEWDEDPNDPEFHMSGETLESLVQALEKKSGAKKSKKEKKKS